MNYAEPLRNVKGELFQNDGKPLLLEDVLLASLLVVETPKGEKIRRFKIAQKIAQGKDLAAEELATALDAVTTLQPPGIVGAVYEQLDPKGLE
jgi:hypothetical protein